jgi:hypothetical protein
LAVVVVLLCFELVSPWIFTNSTFVLCFSIVAEMRVERTVEPQPTATTVEVRGDDTSLLVVLAVNKAFPKEK